LSLLADWNSNQGRTHGLFIQEKNMNAKINQSSYRHVKLMALVSLLGFSLLSLHSTDLLATPASPVPFTLEQPDGQNFTARNQGDEWNNWVENEDGYTIAQDNNGFWYYVSGFSAPISARRLNASGLNQGDVVPQQPVLTDVPATDLPPAELPQHIHPTNQRPPMNLNNAPVTGSPLSQTFAVGSNTTGVRNVVFILAGFSNQPGSYQQPAWATFVTNSIGDYYRKASYGKVSITPAQEDDTVLGNSAAANNGVIGWINISPQLKALEISLRLGDQTGNHPNTGQNINQYNRLIAKAAMQAADPYIDYSYYDGVIGNNDGYVTADELAVVVIVAGYERSYSAASPSVWGHSWQIFSGSDGGLPYLDGKFLGTAKGGVGPLNTTGGYAQFGERHGDHQATMGIMIHELSHEIFGCADLYDVKYATIDGQINRGIGGWSVMAYGSWAAKPGEPLGATPVLPDAWTKWQMGWINPILQRDRILLTGVGVPTATSDNSVYKVSTNGATTEYFLIENRQNQGYDLGLQSSISGFKGGLAIWHIDDSISCQDNQCNSVGAHPHPRVYLEAGNRTWITGSATAQQNDLFFANGGWRTILDGISTPTNSNLWNGAVKGGASGVSINSISNSLSIMRVRVPQ
jgi:M6 family metalloprotease-like protein